MARPRSAAARDGLTERGPAPGRRRLRLLVAYDGAPFAGWQVQAPGKRTVQGELEAAFARVAGAPVSVQGSGRTDAGVHADGQTAHADVPTPARGSKMAAAVRWPGALNGHLPPEIRVLGARWARRGFHARFSATGKEYAYRIRNAPALHPRERGWAWHVPGPLDLGRMREAAALFLGRHDFGAFAARRGPEDANTDTVRTIHALRLRRRGELITLDVRGDGFLYKMVRLLTGALVRVGQGRAEARWIAGLLENPRGPKNHFLAPAEGLCLRRVLYQP